MPFGVEPAGLKTTTGSRTLSDLPQQRALDILMGDGIVEDQAIRVIET